MRVGKVFSMLVDYGRGDGECHRAYWSQALRPDSPLLGKLYQDRLAISFQVQDAFFATALNAQLDGWDVTHLVMLHNDVVPMSGWIDALLEEMEVTRADMLSVVLPIKNDFGLTSTAVDSGDPFRGNRRLTVREVCAMPRTSPPGRRCAACGGTGRDAVDGGNAAGCDHCAGTGTDSWVTFGSEGVGGRLLVNTGCFAMRFTEPWRLLTDPDGNLSLCRNALNRVAERGGRWECRHAPSDWALSRHLHSVGARVMATTRVRAAHVGDGHHRNDAPWGAWETDAENHRAAAVCSTTPHGSSCMPCTTQSNSSSTAPNRGSS